MNQVMGQQSPQAQKSGTMSLDKMNQILQGSGPSPSQSYAALGHSNGIITNALKSGWGALQSVSSGIRKGVESTELGIGELGSKALGAKDVTQNIEQMKNSPAIQPQNVGETIGKTGEQIGEFFLPSGVESKAAEEGASYLDKIPEILGLGEKAAKYVSGGLKTALQGLISGISMGGVTAAQTGGDMSKTQSATELGIGAGVLGKTLETFGSGLAESLNKSDFKLSPATEAKTQKIADNAAKFITENRIVGSASTKYAKLNHLNSQFETVLQKSLPEGIAIDKNEVMDSIRTSIEQLKQTDPAIYNQAKTKSDQAMKLLQDMEGNILSPKEVLQSKRSWAQDAFKTAKKSKQDPTVSSEGAYAVEQAYQKALGGAFDRSKGAVQIPSPLRKYFGGAPEVSLSDFNKVYSDAINAKNLSFMAQFKSDAGLFGRLFGLWAGESIGQAVSPGLGGKVVGGAAGEILSTHLPGAVRNVGERVLTRPGVPEGAAKIYQGANDSLNQ